ncbi:MAG: penicillin-binding protein 2 [Candidatus Rokubacteria bacterium]|nr:penicillin-binding protein 2 [Candidatus Rokubacteria bacterium]
MAMRGLGTGGTARRDPFGRRLLFLSGCTLAGFLVLLGQLWYLQVLEGTRLRDLSERNRIRVRPAAAPRGILFDRNGLALVDNRPAFTLSLIPREMENRETVLARLSILLRIPLGEFEELLARVPPDSFMAVRVRRGLTMEEVAKVEEWKLELPGVVVEVEPQRVYPSPRFGAHLLGYVREVSEEQMRQGRYRRGDMTGQSGLERMLDEYLRGRDGGEEIEVDALGRPVRVVRRQDPRPGAHVVTTVDRRIQEVVERAMGSQAGAAVVLDARSGDVLALASTPAYELDRFTGALGREAWLRLVRDPQFPLLNRAIQSQYAPGSVFKVVVAAAALQEGVITPFDRLRCASSFQLGRRTFKNWENTDWGEIDLYRAIVRSCNTFFYQLGLKVGPEPITRYARAFGLGEPTGIALGGEKPGLIPGPRGPRERAGRSWKSWRSGDTVNVSIGQGSLLVTPLQVARMTAAVATGGVLWKPRLVQRVEGPDGRLLYSEPSRMNGYVELSPAVWAFLQRSLWGVVNEGGTGAAARLPGIEVAGKTGTAQIIARSDASRGQDHAWFAGYAPAQDPQVVVVVLAERGGKGGQAAAPIARQILHGIFLERVASASLGG